MENINFSGHFKNSETEKNFRNEFWPFYRKKMIFSIILILAVSFSIDFNKIILFNFTREIQILILLKLILFFLGITSIIFILSEKAFKIAPLFTFLFMGSVSVYISAELILKTQKIFGFTSLIILFSAIFFYTLFNLKMSFTIAAQLFSFLIFTGSLYYFINPEINELIYFIILFSGVNFLGILISLKISKLERKVFFYKNHSARLSRIIRSKISSDKNQSKFDEQFIKAFEKEFIKAHKQKTKLKIMMMEINELKNFEDKIKAGIVENFLKISINELDSKKDYFLKNKNNLFLFISHQKSFAEIFSFAERINSKLKNTIFKSKNSKFQISFNFKIVSLKQEKHPMELLEKAYLELKKTLK